MKKELYKNASLVEAVFEIRFPGEPAVECQRDKFFEKIRDVYPAVMVPKAYPDRPLSLDPYSFIRKDDLGSVMVALNKLSVSCKKYEGFKMFKKEVLRVTAIFGKLFKIRRINRTGLRYINVIPMTREGNLIPLKNYLNIGVNLPESIPADFKNLSIVFVSQTKGGSITTRVEPVVSQDQTREALLLDFDYAKEDDLSFGGISEYIEESHRHTKHMFEQLVTEDYKKFMRGEVI